MASTLSFDGDTAALKEFESRIAGAARARDVVTYSGLVQGVSICLPNVSGGSPFELGIPEWMDLHRAILGEYLFRLSHDSFQAGQFFSSAVVVSKAEMMPSDGFRELLLQVGLIGSKTDTRWMDVWITHLNLAYDWSLDPRHG